MPYHVSSPWFRSGLRTPSQLLASLRLLEVLLIRHEVLSSTHQLNSNS